MKSLTKKEVMRRIRLSMKTKIEKYGTINSSPLVNSKVTWKQAWREIGGRKIYFRSSWEANYARYLEFLKSHGKIKDWLHEPQTFWFEKIKRGSVTYLPDFKIINNDDTHFWVEVKGWMDARSKTKIRRFKKYFPNESLTLIQQKWFTQNNPIYRSLIPAWE